MAQLIDWLHHSGARDSAGAVVASGKVYFYQPGTVSTQVTVYTDPDGLSALTQPLTLDASGKGTVYTKRDVKIVVRNAADTSTITTTDRGNTTNARAVEVENSKFNGTNLSGGGTVAGGRTDLDAILTLLGTSAGGTDGKFNQGGTTDLTLEDAVGWCVQAAEYGAVGDDATDNATALNAAIAAAVAANKPLWIGPGTFRVGSALTATGATALGLIIMGCGRGVTVLKNVSTSNDLLTIDLSSAIEGHIVIRDIGFTAVTTSSGAALKLSNGNGTVIERCNVSLHRIGFDTSSVSFAVLRDCLVTSTDSNAAGKGFRLGPFAHAEDCRVTAATNGIAFSLEGGVGRAHLCRALSAATGYSVTGSTCSLSMCRASDCTTGFSLAADDCVALSSQATGTITTGFSVGAVARSGCMYCSSTVGGTADFATNASATDTVELGCNFTTRSLNEKCGDTSGKSRAIITPLTVTDNGAGASFTPDPANGISVHVCTSAALTVNATSTTGLKNGQIFTVVIDNDLGGNSTPTWNAQYVGADGAAIGSGNYRATTFVWVSAISRWCAFGERNGTGEWS